MPDIFGMIAGLLGPVMKFIYDLVHNYFIAIFIFTLLIRILLFPTSLKQQKNAVDRARIAPRLERIQKKYANDRQKLAQKQQELYERHGVKMTGGCLPLLLSMLVLLGVIGVIYSPITYLSDANANTVQVIEMVMEEDMEKLPAFADGNKDNNLREGYYKELDILKMLNQVSSDGTTTYREMVIAELNDPSIETLKKVYGENFNQEQYEANKDSTDVNKNYVLNFKSKVLNGKTAEEICDNLTGLGYQFMPFGVDNLGFLDQPWTADASGNTFNWLWIVPLISGGTSFLVSFISMKYQKKAMPQNQPGQGCTNNMMLIYMPAFSTFIAFTVPGAVGIYWIISNLFSLLQTFILNKIYDPAKARAEAEKEYQERRRQKQEDKKRLARARQREEAEARKAEQELERQREESREMNKNKKKGSSAAKQPQNEEKPEENGTTDAVETTQPVEDAAETATEE